jgi:uncharacterized phiE125 gp8 family phage protein
MTPLAPVLVTPPAAAPISLAEVKAHCHVLHPDDDDMLQGLIEAATRYCDGWTGILGRCIVTQTWAQSFDGFPVGDMIRLPFPDVTSVTLTYRDADNQAQTFAAANYALVADARSAKIVLAQSAAWPSTYGRPDAVTVSMVAGFGGVAAVPPPIKIALLHLVSHWWRNRSAVSPDAMANTPMTFEALIAPWRAVRL